MSFNRRLLALRILLAVVVGVLVWTSGAWAQNKFKTLHKFTDGHDGGNPVSGLVLDSAGNLYGTTVKCCGSGTAGVVFKLTPNPNGSWIENTLYTFCSVTNCGDGSSPMSGVIFDAAGNLYGTTTDGGANHGRGVVFKLMPHPDGSWTESVLYTFCTGDCLDGSTPHGTLIFDHKGNLYGTTLLAGPHGGGTVFKLTPNSDGSWTQSVLYGFGGNDGNGPYDGVIFDAAGDLYGTTFFGGANDLGVAFKLIPESDGSWKERVLHSFAGGADGVYPFGGLVLDQSGNLYGTTQNGGNNQCSQMGCGVVFEISPQSGGGWKEKVLLSFDVRGGARPFDTLIFDHAGNLYGTAQLGGGGPCAPLGCGVVFKLVPNLKGGWNEKLLHVFLDHPGSQPLGNLVFDAAGNLYGTTSCYSTLGSVFEIMQ